MLHSLLVISVKATSMKYTIWDTLEFLRIPLIMEMPVSSAVQVYVSAEVYLNLVLSLAVGVK